MFSRRKGRSLSKLKALVDCDRFLGFSSRLWYKPDNGGYFLHNFGCVRCKIWCLFFSMFSSNATLCLFWIMVLHLSMAIDLSPERVLPPPYAGTILDCSNILWNEFLTSHFSFCCCFAASFGRIFIVTFALTIVARQRLGHKFFWIRIRLQPDNMIPPQSSPRNALSI